MAKYIVTGGCGFIGSKLVNQLIDLSHEVLIIDNLSNAKEYHPKADFLEQDITQLDAIQPAFSHYDGCFHLAAIPTVEMDIAHWFKIHQVNLQGSLNVFYAAIAAGNIPVVYASSCGVYGNCTTLPLKEEQVIHPISAYGCDKYASELNAHFLSHVFQLPSLGLRIFNVYGPGQNPKSPYSGVITHFIDNIQQKKPLTIFGDGEQTRDFIYVDDVVNILINSMNTLNKGAHVVNACTGRSISINEVANHIAKLYNVPVDIQYAPARALDVAHSCGDKHKMHQYGFDAPTPLADGLVKLKSSLLT